MNPIRVLKSSESHILPYCSQCCTFNDSKRRNRNFLTFPYHLFQKAYEEEAGNFDVILSFDVLKQGVNLGDGDSGVRYSYENQLDVVPGYDLRKKLNSYYR